MRRPGPLTLVVLLAALAGPLAPAALAQGDVSAQSDANHPASAAQIARAWIREWDLRQPAGVCKFVARPLQVQMALASGPGTCAGAVASALAAAARDTRTGWTGVSVARERVRLVTPKLAEVTFGLRQELRRSGGTIAPVRPERIQLIRDDSRTGGPWRVATLGTLPFIVSGAAGVALDPSTLDPPAVEPARLTAPVPQKALRPACSGQSVTEADPAGDVRLENPVPRAAGQLLPEHQRGPQFGTITAGGPFVATGAAADVPSLDLLGLGVQRGSDGRICLTVRYAAAPRPDSRLLIRWFEPTPGSETAGASGAVELRFDGRGALHLWFDSKRTSVADPDLATRYAPRVPDVGRSGTTLSIRLSASDSSAPERVRVAVRTASSAHSDPLAPTATPPAGDAIGTARTGLAWPAGGDAPLVDPNTGPTG